VRTDFEISNFTAGELSPRLKGRTDYKNYYSGLDTCLNMVVLPQGGMTRRPGCLLAALAKDQTDTPFRTRNIRFIFSTVQAYVLEFSNLNVRVYMNDGVVLNGLTPVDIVTPYTAAELAQIQYTQSADTLFLLHPNHPPAKLTRSSHINWAYAALTFLDGPYLPVNTTTTTLTPSGVSGSITITASSIVGINVTPQSTGQGFLASDVGRLMRIQLLSLWAWCIITAVADTLNVTATVQSAVANGASGALDGAPWVANTTYVTGAVVLQSGATYQAIVGGVSGPAGPSGTGAVITDGTVQWQFLAAGILPAATTQWRLGKWGATNGYPQIPMFWQQRLVFLGTNFQPSAVEASVTADYTNMSPTQADGTTTDNNALSWVISDDQVNGVRWVSPAGSAIAQQLGIGTSGAEQIMQPATNSQALSPTNVQVYQETQIGSSEVPALRIGKSVLFVNRSGRFLMDWLWQWAINGYMAIDRTVDSEHITRPDPATLQGIIATAYQQTPYRVVWCVRGDGALIGLTFMPEQNVYAWHRHQLGGQYYGGPPVVESVCCIPSPDGSYDELWLSVLRTVAGVPTRTIEVMARYFDGVPAEQAFFVDCGLSSALNFPINATITPSAASGNGATFTTNVGAFSPAVVGNFLRLNGGLVLVKTFFMDTKIGGDYWRPARNVRPVAPGEWSITAQSASFSGLSYLNGETVQMLGDGADMGKAVVAGGSVTLPNAFTASYATIGLPYAFRAVTMPFAPQRAPQSVQGRAKRIDHLYLRFVETLAVSYGRVKTDSITAVQTDVVDAVLTRSAGDVMGQAPALFSGIKRLPSPGGYDEEGQILITGEGPYPCTVLAIEAKGATGEVGT
jgi:hypothetical protein